MRITYHDKTVELSEHDVACFSFALGIAKRAPEAQATEKAAAVRQARAIWTQLGVWGDVTP